MTILIIHGFGGHAGIHWQQWLHDALSNQGHQVIMPNLSDAEHPDRQIWLKEIINAVDHTNLNELVIVGHSLGVTTALDFIEQASTPIQALVSVSGFATDYGAAFNSYFLQAKTIDFAAVRKHITQSYVLYSDNDPYVTQEALQEVANELNIKPIIIPDAGHFNTESGFSEFPELKTLITQQLLLA